MREIIFRAKIMDTAEWIEGLYYRYDYVRGDGHFINTPDLDIAINLETLGQFTGLCDKNGTKIFEGDIVECGGYFDKPQIVIWDKEWCAFQPIFDASPIEAFPILSRTEVIEVIGNIYDNKDLLEGEN